MVNYTQAEIAFGNHENLPAHCWSEGQFQFELHQEKWRLNSMSPERKISILTS